VSKKTFISFDDAVAEYGLEPRQLRAWMRDGELRAFRFHNKTSFRRTEVEKLAGGSSSGLAPDLEDFLPKPVEDEWSGDRVFPLRVPRAGPANTAESDEPTTLSAAGPGRPPSRNPNSGPPEDDEEETFLEPLEDGEQEGAAPDLTPPPPSKVKPGEVVRFRCWCGKRLKSDLEYVHQKVQCPRCGEKLDVPTEDEARLLGLLPSGIHVYLKRIRREQKRLREDLTNAVADLTHLTEGSTADDLPTDEVPTLDGEGRLREVEHKVKELERGIQALSADIAQLLKQNEEVRFDIARLYDLISRVSPASTIPAKPIREAKAEAGEDG